MAGPGSSSSHAILDLGEDELQFSTHDYKTKVIVEQEEVVRISSIQCCGSGMFIPDPTFFHPGSRIRTVSIPDPHQRIKYFNPNKSKKWFQSSKKYDPGCSSRIPDPDADFLPSQIPGSKKHSIPDPGSGSATLVPSPCPNSLYVIFLLYGFVCISSRGWIVEPI
jgi:hypothetical protein